MFHRLVSACLACGLLSAAEMKPTSHPFLLWTKDQLAELRERVTSDADAKLQVEQMLAMEARQMKAGGNPDLLALFRYAVLGDAAAGAAQKKALMAFAGASIPDNKAGDPNSRNAAWRDDRTLDALRYDVLYDLLSPEERKAIEDAARRYVAWCVANPGPWSNAGTIDENAVKVSGNATSKARTGWLPNMQWPTMIGSHVLAVAIQDEQAMRSIAGCDGGWQWYFDHYIADGRFYMEEFAKYSSNIGGMVLWCNGAERLGLGELGWGYTGKGGATMRRFLGSLIDATLPRVARAGAPGAWNYPVVWMGDAGREWVVENPGPVKRWYQARMQGTIAKMRAPLWWEAGHQRFPDAGFDWFLAEHRAAGEERYLPSLYFGLKPIAAAAAKPPPAPSVVAKERGFALLRSDESPAYWSSPRPAVALQFGMYYVHYVHDCFSLLDFVANNRFIYTRVGRSGSGYAGGDAWLDHCRGQPSAVVVDDLQAKFVDGGENGCANQRIRSRLDGPVRYCAVRANGIYPEVDQERALVLSAEYLVDVSWLVSGKPRVYDWHVLSPGFVTAPSDGWEPAPEALARSPMTAARSRSAGDAAWTATIRLDAAADAQPGVRVTMLGEPGTTLIQGRPPGIGADGPGVKLMATRTAPAACFAVVHEPLAAGAASRLRTIERLAQDAGGVAVRLVGEGIDDRVVIRTGDAAAEPAVFAGGGESLTVADQAWVRIGPAQVEAWGDVRALELKVTGTPVLRVNGAEAKATVADGVLRWRR